MVVKPDIVFDEVEHIYLVDGVEVPSVTTILQPLANRAYSSVNPSVLEYARNRGSAVHEALELYDLGAGLEASPEIEGYVKAYLEWEQIYKPSWVGVEQIVYSVGDKYIGTPYSVYDCQAFVERMLADAGLSMNLAGSNAWYRTMSWRGTPEQCKATFGCIPTGAFLFIVAHDGGEPAHYNDNLGNANHIGVVIHRDLGAIHSSQRKGGVYYSLFQDATIPNGG